VDVLREVEADEGAHRFPMVLEIAYPDRNALEEALASPTRALGREATRGLFEFFEGRIFHAVYEVLRKLAVLINVNGRDGRADERRV